MSLGLGEENQQVANIKVIGVGGGGAPFGLLMREADGAGDLLVQGAVGGSDADAVFDLCDDLVELRHFFALRAVQSLENTEGFFNANDHLIDGILQGAIGFLGEASIAGGIAGEGGAGSEERGGENGGGDDVFHDRSFFLVGFVDGVLPHALTHAGRAGFLSVDGRFFQRSEEVDYQKGLFHCHMEQNFMITTCGLLIVQMKIYLFLI